MVVPLSALGSSLFSGSQELEAFCPFPFALMAGRMISNTTKLTSGFVEVQMDTDH